MRADAVRNYERIVGAAVEAFEEVGPEVTLEEIATRADVSAMTLYRRFRTRDHLVQAVFDHVLATEIEPKAAVHTDDPFRDLAGVLEAVIEVIARRPVINSLAFEFTAFASDSAQRFLNSVEPVLRRAIDAGVVRPELQVRDVTAVIIMAMATTHPADPGGADRRRYLTLLIDGLRPAPTTLPQPSPHDFSPPPAHLR
ncbi:TetR/AcrR family transcriptional regulator [Amycolatopsis sp. NPDC003865]